jgi:hypothetical protein
MNASESSAWDQRCAEMADEINAKPIEALPLRDTELDAGAVATTWYEKCEQIATDLQHDVEEREAGRMSVAEFDEKW